MALGEGVVLVAWAAALAFFLALPVAKLLAYGWHKGVEAYLKERCHGREDDDERA